LKIELLLYFGCVKKLRRFKKKLFVAPIALYQQQKTDTALRVAAEWVAVVVF
jgi:hypothetical protein